VVYQNAVSTAPWTTPSVASMLTSRYPRRLGYGQHPAYLAPKEVTVAEVLRNRGYRTHAITSNTFAGRSVGFDAGFEWMDFSLAAGQMDVTSGDLTDHAIAWLDENGDQPFFLYLHYFDPHFAYVMHPEFKFDYVYDGPMRDQESHTEFTLSMPSLTQADVDWVTAAYDSEIAYTDQYIGQLLDHLRAKGLYDNTLIVFVGDHGEAFNDRGDHYIGHARTVWQELLHVPLIVKMPGGDGAGTNVLTRVSTMDIAPTILAAAGASFPESEPIDGKPLSTAPMDRLLISETRRDANLRAAFQGHWKLIVDRDKKTSALYDLEADPGEKHDVSAEHRDIADKLEVSVDVWENSLGHHNSAAAPFSADAIQRLKGLGYWQ
jgi:arylsulfatase A-like enzyme